ncbi:phosphate ABC transporter permease PstA [Photobacterium sp. WH77]|uniref:phosphate ABC transporter permease PstA n=1 Tax=Photobacterium TaxID=657 RepID=UPI001C441856|nr:MULTISPECIES: phosphate ABC transporter permease PstA [Photobacterium]MBV7260484.1 phosphate ABC transporter permease PstA [Photobacterium sp. WH24]MCG2835603.1 phosphate ABC transporter permease PstA [Photobacterium sp. WH77]MCG2843216.1 phosphate ABC transporter permease PstA [Photobacterium sp. WH80]MDO6580913.1 phosphate ABC transporter permease PstA [Photobacterium sp. 2_MG-2023]
MLKWMRSGSPWIWLTAGTVSLSLLAVLGLLLMIGWKGLSYFWPAQVYRFDVSLADHQQVIVGEIYETKQVPRQQLLEAGYELAGNDNTTIARYLIKTGNRELADLDFVTLLDTQIRSKEVAHGVAVIDRLRNGKFYGYPQAVMVNGSSHSAALLPDWLSQAEAAKEAILELQQNQYIPLNRQLASLAASSDKASESRRGELLARLREVEHELGQVRQVLDGQSLLMKDAEGREVQIPLADILDVWYPNDMSFSEKVAHWGRQLGHFVTDAPREANTEGGVFPAIFGTVLMVLLMSVIVTPLGVLAAIYLHEYAKQNRFTRLIRVAVINLAGVPSIVYGVFGLGFFVYMVGGTIDELFFSDQLPAPTFGTPGILWSALTLAILTLPVVIVSTEEGLARIPPSIRHGSLALGATQAETLWRIVIPMASPAIMTGLILAVARAAGEVAPLMLVGVVKMAPSLPIDAQFPYLHLDRKFMHLGYHIYDVGFQSPNVEAARPLVYATSLLLVTVIIGLNLTAIGIRNHLREKFRDLEQ